MAGRANDTDADKQPSRLAGLGERVRQEASELKSRFRTQASRTWKVSNLRLEIALLERKRGRKLTELGELSYRLMQAGEVSTAPLRGLYREIEDLRREIEEKEREVEACEGASGGPGAAAPRLALPGPPAESLEEARPVTKTVRPRQPMAKRRAKTTGKVKSS